MASPMNYSRYLNNTHDGFLDSNWLTVLGQANTIIMTCNVIILMLGMGAATYWREIIYHLRHPWKCLMGLVCQSLLLPGFGFVLCLLLPLHPYEAISILILVCSPGGAFSNFFTYWMDGDLALSILLTTLSSLMSFGLMPLSLFLLTHYWPHDTLHVPYIRILLSLCFVSGPCIAGMILRNYSRKWAKLISKICGLIGWVGAIIVGVLLILMYWPWFVSTEMPYAIAAAAIPAGSAILAFVINKAVCFDNAVARTIALETGSQNMVVATNVILISFSDPEMRGVMVLFPVLYGLMLLGQVFVAIIGFRLWKFIRRDVVTEEDSPSVIDNSILTRVDIPSNQNVGAKERRRNVVPDVVRYPNPYNNQAGQRPTSQHQQSSGYITENTPDESSAFLHPPPPSYEEVLQDMLPYNRQEAKEVYNPYMAQNMRSSENDALNQSRRPTLGNNNQNTIVTTVYATPVASLSEATYSNMNNEQDNIPLTEMKRYRKSNSHVNPKPLTPYNPTSSNSLGQAIHNGGNSEIQSPFSELSRQYQVEEPLHHSTASNILYSPSSGSNLDNSQESITHKIIQTENQLPEFDAYRRMTESNLQRLNLNSKATRKISEPLNPNIRRKISKENQTVYQGFPSDTNPFFYISNSSMSDYSISDSRDSRDSRLPPTDNIAGASNNPVINAPPNTPTSPPATSGSHVRSGFFLEDIHEGQRSNFRPFIRRK